MANVFGLIVALVGLYLVLRLVWPEEGVDFDRPIDVSDPRVLGTLIGLTGGSIGDAALARYALKRFEALHGRKATLRDAATVAGLLKTSRL